jgi:type VI secretion system secreted protein Hcp
MARGDMFLKVETARQGTIKGEARDADHPNEIDVVGWSWGMRAQTGMGAGGDASKATLDELSIVKRVDSASTALMAGMRNNDLVKKATLTVRKAGSTPLEYVKIVVENGRITGLQVNSEETELTETLTLAYKHISVEYTAQGADGAGRASSFFETDIT